MWWCVGSSSSVGGLFEMVGGFFGLIVIKLLVFGKIC